MSESFANEADILNRLRHPNIVEHIENFHSRTHSCLVMEFCPLGTLAATVDRARDAGRRLRAEIVGQWFGQLLMALAHMHKLHVLHRDVKSENIFLSLAGTVQLGDMGVSTSLAASASMARSLVGTPLYMAPEVLAGQPYGWQADMWSAGCVLNELVTLHRPFNAPDVGHLKQLHSTFRAPGAVADVAPSLVPAVELTMQMDPAFRQCAAALLKEPFIDGQLGALVSAVDERLPRLEVTWGRSSTNDVLLASYDELIRDPAAFTADSARVNL